MSICRTCFHSVLLLVLVSPCVAMTHARRGPTSHKLFSKRAAKPSAKPVGQHGIDSARATEIQTALISSGYLSGEASGQWDSATEAAMQRFQADNGWQTKLIPDSRAIIKLGLGPSSSVAQGTGSANQAQQFYGSPSNVPSQR